jgi:hypothetical protein
MAARRTHQKYETRTRKSQPAIRCLAAARFFGCLRSGVKAEGTGVLVMIAANQAKGIQNAPAEIGWGGGARGVVSERPGRR